MIAENTGQHSFASTPRLRAQVLRSTSRILPHTCLSLCPLAFSELCLDRPNGPEPPTKRRILWSPLCARVIGGHNFAPSVLGHQ